MRETDRNGSCGEVNMAVERNSDSSAEVSGIRELVRRQYSCLNWTRERDADWGGFADTFLAGAALFSATRPVQPQTVDQFVDRMKRLRAEGKLATFEETPLGCEVRVFGNVAVAFVACEMLENAATVTRDVSAVVLVRDHDRWRIAAQAWDNETQARKIPDDLAVREAQ
ncbi:MAG: nuclear transport factor 2 family protein [Steroidobacteraceae bacterium]